MQRHIQRQRQINFVPVKTHWFPTNNCYDMENIISEHYFQCCCSPWYHPIASFAMFFSFIDSFFFASFFCPLCSDRISSGNMITFTMGPLTYNNTQSLELPEIVSQNNAKCCKIFLIETRERSFFGSCFTRYSMTFLDMLCCKLVDRPTNISCRLKKS